jgi:tetratricopeptide (TPR) repeat protein
MDKTGLSIVMIAKNEESHLPRCLDSVINLADEVVMVDTGSTDKTMDIAESRGAKVVREKWQEDFAKARNRSIDEAQGRWLLWLDADDVVAVGEHDRIRNLVAKNENAAYAFIIENEYEGRKGQAFRQVRLFPAGKGVRFEGAVHESLSPSLNKAGIPILQNDIRILHTGYNRAEDREKKMKRNHTLLQEEFGRAPDDPAVLMELGNSFFQKKDFEQAIALYLRLEKTAGAAEKQRDVHNAAPTLLGTAFFEMGLYEDAKRWLTEACARTPDSVAPWYFLGQIALRQNDPETLLKMFEKVIEMRPAISTVASDITGMKANAYAFAGNLYFVRGNFARAAELFAEAEEQGLPPAFQYETAADAAKRAGRSELTAYFRAKSGIPKGR